MKGVEFSMFTDLSCLFQVSCVLEKKLVSMDEAERKTFCESNSVQSCLTKVRRVLEELLEQFDKKVFLSLSCFSYCR